MAVEIRITQDPGGASESVGDWGEAFVGVYGVEFLVEGHTTSETIASWRIEALSGWGDSAVVPTLDTPAVLAENADDSSPTTTGSNLDPTTAGSYLLRLTTWPEASYSGTPSYDYRAIGFAYLGMGVAPPPPVVVSAWKTAIAAQIAAAQGSHDNVDGFEYGFGGPPSGTMGLTAFLEEVEKQRLVRVPAAVAYSATIEIPRSGYVTYSGSDASQVLEAGSGPHLEGACLDILFPSGTITGANTVTCAANLHPAGETFDASYDYRVIIVVARDGVLLARASLEPATDVTPPTVSSATVQDADPDALIIVFDENVTFPNTTGWSLSGVAVTITGVSGADDTWSLALSGNIVPSDSFSVVYSGSNTVEDLSANPLAADSTVVTNNVAYPTISSAATNVGGDQITIVFSEAVTATGITGMSLSGTSAAFASVASGSGTSTVIFNLSPSVQASETVTMNVAGTNDIDDLHSNALQTVSGQSVTNNVPGGLSFDADCLCYCTDENNSDPTVTDDSSAGNDGTIQNSGATVTDPDTTHGDVVQLAAASTQWVSFANGVSPPRSGDFTIAIAVRQNSWTAANVNLVTGNSSNNFNIYTLSADSNIYFAVNEWNDSINAAHGMSANTWALIMVARIDSTNTGYIYVNDFTDGNHIATGTIPDLNGTQVADNIHFGSNSSGSSGVTGYIDGMTLVEKALSQSERNELATALGF